MKAIAAMARNRVIGREGRMPWRLPEDFKWFKECTSGHVVLMGRKTFESLGRPLPNRLNVVVTRGPEIGGVQTIRDLEAFDPQAHAARDVWVIGGAEVYRQMLPRCSDLYLSVLREDYEGDAFFPPFEETFERIARVREYEAFDVWHYRNRAVRG